MEELAVGLIISLIVAVLAYLAKVGSSPEMAHAWDQAFEGKDYFLTEALSSFEFGLARVLDGIDDFIESKST